MTIAAKHEDGVFKPLEEVTIVEGTIVEVLVLSNADRVKTKSLTIGDSGFFGMWKDRKTSGIVSNSSRIFAVISGAKPAREKRCRTGSTAICCSTFPAAICRRGTVGMLQDGWAILRFTALELMAGA
jgi:hypothetical protein